MARTPVASVAQRAGAGIGAGGAVAWAGVSQSGVGEWWGVSALTSVSEVASGPWGGPGSVSLGRSPGSGVVVGLSVTEVLPAGGAGDAGAPGATGMII